MAKTLLLSPKSGQDGLENPSDINLVPYKVGVAQAGWLPGSRNNITILEKPPKFLGCTRSFVINRVKAI
jgi:hypothetical protein